MFVPTILMHGERMPWSIVTHVRLKPGAIADTPAGQRILEHIRKNCDSNGITTISSINARFPAVRSHPTPLQAMRHDLRHLANLRESGSREENKGLIEVGIIVADSEEHVYPDEVDEEIFVSEGSKKRIFVNSYERDRSARARCIEAWGTICVVCGFDFERVYGGRGVGFIHVHHIKPISTIGHEYKLDPINDLRPICPNCHAILHRANPAPTIEEMKRIVDDMREQ